MLIGVTNFFRDPEAFELLRHEFIPKLLATKKPGENIRIWIPGCSTGEEAYSIAILLHESMREEDTRLKVQIFASDIDEQATNKARVGIYSTSIGKDLSKERLQKYFTMVHDGYKINKEIRNMIIFAHQNIIKDPPFTRLDLICCRNLLIYFDIELQRRLLPILHYSLVDDGILFLGSSESMGAFIELFLVVNKKWKIFKKRGSTSFNASLLSFTSNAQSNKNPVLKSTNKGDKHLKPRHLCLAEYACNASRNVCFVINNKGKIVNSPLPSEGELSAVIYAINPHNPPVVCKCIQDTIQSVIEHREQWTQCATITIECKCSALHSTTFTVRANAVHLTPSNVSYYLLSFSRNPPQREEQTIMENTAILDNDQSVLDLQQELESTKADLQSLVEELEASNEELKSTNEELQSTNEELQSTNEELETSKEEQQSLNEELGTVNKELSTRIDELLEINEDTKNMLNTLNISAIFLDKDMCIRHFTENAKEIINLIDSDIGRPIGHIAPKIKYGTLVHDAQNVLNNANELIMEAEGANHSRYFVSLRPYLSISGDIDGVIITFEAAT